MEDIEAQNVQPKESGAPAIFKKANRPVLLKFEDVKYSVKTKIGGKKNEKSTEKQILKGLTGKVCPGEMLAMLGPSGSGKTTFLTALGGRLIGGDLTGTITYNGKPFSNAMKRNTGFVTQDDVLYPHLTVSETLIFTALLRLPNTLKKQEKVTQAEAVITQLGLTKCKDSIIGGPMLRGISGGERKRVSIGQEMLINPSLLFLDEPTSGLDSTTAQRIVSSLRDLANGGRTIVMTIHQPSSRLFYMFNKVVLLSEGNFMYFGKGAEAMDYFASIGFLPIVAMNPSDFLLDLANGVSMDGSHEDPIGNKETLINAYKSNLGKRVETELQEFDGFIQEISDDRQFKRWPTTWCQQFRVLLKRGLKERRHEAFSYLKIAQVVIVALLSGLLWWQSDVSHLQDQIGLLFFYCSFWGFFPLFQAIFTFPQEIMMLQKERSSGMYKLSSYFMSQIVGDLPMELALPTLFVLITYWMAGLKATPENFFYTLFTLLFSVLAAQGLGLAIGALVTDVKKATVLGSVLMLTFNLTGGYFVQHIPSFIAWIKYISLNQYSFELLLKSQYKPGDTYPCENGTCLIEDFPSIKPLGLRGQGVAIGALVVMVIGYRLIAYIALMRIGVTRKL